MNDADSTGRGRIGNETGGIMEVSNVDTRTMAREMGHLEGAVTTNGGEVIYETPFSLKGTGRRKLMQIPRS